MGFLLERRIEIEMNSVDVVFFFDKKVVIFIFDFMGFNIENLVFLEDLLLLILVIISF